MVRLFQFENMPAIGNHVHILVQHEKHVHTCQKRIDMIRFKFHHAVQHLKSFFRLIRRRIGSDQISHRLEILLQLQRFSKTFDGIRYLSYFLGADTVVFQNIEIFLIVLAFFLFRCCSLRRRE